MCRQTQYIQADAFCKVSKQCLCLFVLKMWYVKKKFSHLAAKPTNWPLVWDLNPGTPLLTPFDFNQKLNLFKQSLSCQPVEAQVSIDLEGKAHVDVTIGVAASRTITPLAVSELVFITIESLLLLVCRMVLNL